MPEKESAGSSSKSKIIAAVLLLVASIAGAWFYIDSRVSIPETPPPTSADGDTSRQPGPPTAEEVNAFLEEAAVELNLTQEQVKTLKENAPMKGRQRGDGPPNREEMRERWAKVQEVLTEEQAQGLRQMFRQKMRSRMEQVMSRLSPEDQAALRERFENRRRDFGGHRGGGPGGAPSNSSDGPSPPPPPGE